MIRDRNIDYMRQSHFIPANTFCTGIVIGATTGAVIKGTGAGAPDIVELNGVDGLVTMNVGAANDLMCTWDYFTPRHADPREEIGVRVHFSVNSAGANSTADAVTLGVLYNQFDRGETIATPATALDTAIASITMGTTAAKKLALSTARGIINKNTFDFTARQGGMAWAIKPTPLTNFSANEVAVIGLEIDYIPLLCINENERTHTNFTALAAVNS